MCSSDLVIVANTWSNSALYDYESVTYRAVFGPFYNLKLGNRIILGRSGGISPSTDGALARQNAQALEAEFKKRGSGAEFILPLLSADIDWNPGARVLTDQYSPSNLLNALPRN